MVPPNNTHDRGAGSAAGPGALAFAVSSRPPHAPRLWSRLSTYSKRSFRSFTSSHEADDELSSSYSYSSGRMSPASIGSLRGASPSPPARYHGEDTRPTSQKELAGWYMYAFAAETYVICGMSNRTLTPCLLLPLAACWMHI